MTYYKNYVNCRNVRFGKTEVIRLLLVNYLLISVHALIAINPARLIKYYERKNCISLRAMRQWRLLELSQENEKNQNNDLYENLEDTNGDEPGQDIEIKYGDSICRIVAPADGKLPTALPVSLLSSKNFLLEKIDAIYHAMSHAETNKLKYLQLKRNSNNQQQNDNRYLTEEDEMNEAQILRKSLEDAGFELLSQRDLDLCEALNAGYVLRLSIKPDLQGFDPSIGQAFYPELFPDNEEVKNFAIKDKFKKSMNKTDISCPLLFEGKVLVFRRGYSSEITTGRLYPPKIDYLQASLVQRTASFFIRWLGDKERNIELSIRKSKNAAIEKTMETIPEKYNLTRTLNKYVKAENSTNVSENSNKVSKISKAIANIRGIKYSSVSSLDDAINPFLLCEIRYKDDMEPNEGGNYGKEKIMEDEAIDWSSASEILCEYDSGKFRHETNDDKFEKTVPYRLLKRVSISNLVDFFSKGGRRRLVDSFISESMLVEPTYEEVVVLWQPTAKKKRKNPTVTLPNFIYDVAEFFEFEESMPKRPEPETKPQKFPLEIRTFDDIPMANLQAVLPKTKVVIRSADAVLFDLISILSLLAVLASQRFDSPKLDLIAIISVTLWTLRTFFRYSNKFARYDLLVKKFLTTKISHRNTGAVKYIVAEAAQQRALRASIFHAWLLQMQETNLISKNDDQSEDINIETNLSMDQISKECQRGVNDLLCSNFPTRIDDSSAIADLENLGLVTLSEDGKQLEYVKQDTDANNSLKNSWYKIFDKN